MKKYIDQLNRVKLSDLRTLAQENQVKPNGTRTQIINRLLRNRELGDLRQKGGFKLPTVETRKGLRIVSWNILAPELFMYFWRSSYGLKLGKDNQHYDLINKRRIDNVIEYLRSLKANIICLQEVTANTYDYLESKTIQSYVAEKLGYSLTSQSFKDSPVEFSYPPNEQKRTLKADSGVATLALVDKDLKFVRTVMTANEFGASTLFNSGVGSPFTVGEFVFRERKLYVANLHIRMQYPHIKLPLLEVYDRMASRLSKTDLNNTIVTGDFNAHTLESAKDLFASKFYESMFDYQGHELIDDHVFFGNQLRDSLIEVKYPNVAILEMSVNEPATGLRWTLPTTRFKLSPLNNKLISKGQQTTDHLPIIIEIDFETKVSRQRSPSLRNIPSVLANTQLK